MDFQSADQILDFAIKNEETAYKFYMNLANKTDKTHMKQIFTQYAKEEQGHKVRLESVKTGKSLNNSDEKIANLGLADSLAELEMNPNLTYQDSLIIAMKAEKEAFRLYNELASVTDDENLKQLFMSLAQEEAKHKLRFEIEYDNNILKHN